MSKEIVKDENFNDLISFVESKASEITPIDNCKLCQSKHKLEAHKIFDSTKTVAAVVRFLKEKGEEISHTAVSNHINQHYKAIHDHQNIHELAKRLQRWSKMNLSNEAMLTRYIQMLDMEATSLMAATPNLDHATRLKTGENVMKLIQTIALLKDQMQKMDAEKRPVQIIIESLNRIISVKLEDCKNPEVRQALKEVVEQLTRDVDLASPTAGLKEEKE